VFLMLLSSGLGSYVSRRWFPEEAATHEGGALSRSPLLLLLGIVTGLTLYLWLLPWLLASAVGLPFALKLLLSASVLVPIGFLMGMPFPTGLRLLAGTAFAPADSSVEWAWAMNAASSVLGSVLAMVIAIQFGLTAILISGALAYLLAAASARQLKRT
ncbi:MAG: hypothetical protein AB7O65_06920, partial [Candidatus Korobacteraceae bacterium]